MLENGPYPAHLKRRIQGANGHLSNVEAAHVLAELGSDRLRTVFLSHLSAENNQPEVVRQTMEAELGADVLRRLRLILTRRDGPAPAGAIFS